MIYIYLYNFNTLLTTSQPRINTGIPPIFSKATEGTRTPDLLITNQLLYQLSHSSIKSYYNGISFNLQVKLFKILSACPDKPQAEDKES